MSLISYLCLAIKGIFKLKLEFSQGAIQAIDIVLEHQAWLFVVAYTLYALLF